MVPILDPFEARETNDIYLFDMIIIFTIPHVNPFELRLFVPQFLSKNSKQFHPYQQVINNLHYSCFLCFSSIFFYFHIYCY